MLLDVIYDYVIVGFGVGGIFMVDWFSEVGYKVLLIEKGLLFLGWWGGIMKFVWF